MEESFSAAEYDALREYIEVLKEAKLKVDDDFVELYARYKRLREALESSEYQLRQFITGASLTMTQRKRLREINAISSKALEGE